MQCALMLQVLLDVIREEKLDEVVRAAGTVLKTGLMQLSQSYPEVPDGVRGLTCISWSRMSAARARSVLLTLPRRPSATLWAASSATRYSENVAC